ncbi:hypothetical protein GLOIN_2v1546958 [Rhizophagus clarus]|nr:hypothetical protein GLOIN_2v1546958 [Rhizophagus clarus]GES91666.1 hypothetical protein GLOIN_2v1546958 [Rhizophagus clarus]GES99399.1 hypothetical protein GLOIN_2v1546958 [Rhizophagus clarus]
MAEVTEVNSLKEDPSNEREVDYVNKEDQIFSLVSSDYSEEENGDYDVEEEEDIVVRDNKTKKKKSHRKSSDESEFSSTEELQQNRHLQLNPARLQLWAREIINKGTTYEVPPSYPTFDVKSSISVNKNNLAMQAQHH